MSQLTESVVEDAVLAWLKSLGYSILHGPEIAAGTPGAERSDPNYRDVVLERRLRQALERLNPDLPHEALESAFRKLTRVDAPSLIERNRAVHRMLVDGVTVEYRRQMVPSPARRRGCSISTSRTTTTGLAVNQFTVAEGQHTRRPDVVLFVNGLPLAVIELKNPADENATVWSATSSFTTYQAQIPALFATNAALVASDGTQARIGSLGAGKEWFKPWRTITGRDDAPAKWPSCRWCWRAYSRSVASWISCGTSSCSRTRAAAEAHKKMAGYHQFHAVNAAVEETLRAAQAGGGCGGSGWLRGRAPDGGAPGDRRVGVVWHTQGSGKSLTMAFYAGRVILHPAMENPTIVVLTDRNDLDDQLFGTFARCRDLLRQPPVQAADRADLREKLTVASGGVVFTTIQKFFPEENGRPPPGALGAAQHRRHRR